jgi:metallo-beta-lactamase family protein
MSSITFLGASGDVTGSCYLVKGEENNKILVDFGMFQGPRDLADLNYKPLAFNPAELRAVLLTHAHLDHCGRLPLLVYGGFDGKIYMTAPTRDLVEVILTDAAKVAEEKMEAIPLYGPEEVFKTLQMIEVIEYEQEFTIAEFSITFKDAGHILGSASIEVVDNASGKKMVFSGDLGNTPEDIIKPAVYSDNADIVVMETTYGNTLHPQEDVSQILMEEINAIEDVGGVLLIPAFSLERTQELLHRIHHLKKDKKIRGDTPVFMDSPMGIRATEIFKEFKQFYNEEMQSHTSDPFEFEGLATTIESRDSKDIIKAIEPKVIIAGSGMLTGGRILHHAINYLPLKTTRILFVGFQAEGTLGRQIINGTKNIKIRDRKGFKQVQIRAAVRSITTMSSHADQPKLLTWLEHIKGVNKLFLIHGEQQQREAFAKLVQQKLGIQDIVLPMVGQEHDLEFKVSSQPVTPAQPSAPALVATVEESEPTEDHNIS